MADGNDQGAAGANRVTPGAPANAAPPVLDVVIFLPGLGAAAVMPDGPDQSVDGVAQRLATALDHNARTAAATFKREMREQPYGIDNKWTSRVARISRRNPDGSAVPVLDLFRLDYGPTLTQQFERRNVVFRALLALRIVVSGTLLLIRSIGKHGKTAYAKLQLLYAGFIFFLIVAYLLLLLLSIGAAVTQILATVTEAASRGAGQPNAAATTAPSVQNGLDRAATFLNRYQWVQSLVLILTGLGLTLPRDWKDRVNTAAVNYLCALNYIRLGMRRQEMIRQLVALLDRIREVEAEELAAQRGEKVRYGRIFVMGYSFGSVLVLDALFPPESAPEARVSEISGLITVGCPFDLIRTFWREYFRSRGELPGVPPLWLNVFSPRDILGSNFRDNDDGDSNMPDRGVVIGSEDSVPRCPTRNLVYTSRSLRTESLVGYVVDYLTLGGLQAHGRYWGSEPEGEVNCFTQIVTEIYKDHDALK
jgi:hypothetical protein